MKEFLNLNGHTQILTTALIIFAIGTGYYFYKNYRKANTELKILLYLLITGSFYLCFYAFQENVMYNALQKKYSITEGKIILYLVSNKISFRGGSGRNSVEYFYFVNNQKYINKYDENGYVEIPDNKPTLNIKYLVIYQKDNPQNSVILLNYPITSANDYSNYKNIFANSIPNDVFLRD